MNELGIVSSSYKLYPYAVEGNVLSLIANKANNGQVPVTESTSVWKDMSKISNSYNYSNMVSNGNFTLDSNSDGLADGLTGTALATKSLLNNVQTFKANAQTGGIYIQASAIANHKIYCRGMVSSTSSNVRFFPYDGYTQNNMDYTSIGNFQTFSIIKTLGASASYIRLYVQDINTSNWVDIQCKEFMCIDLTALGLDTLTAAQCDELFPFTALTSPSTATSNSRANDCTLNNLALTSSSGFTSEIINGKTCHFLKLDGTDDYGAFVNTPSLDITTNEFALCATFRVAVGSPLSYLIYKGLDSTGSSQYALIYNSGNLYLYLNGASQCSFSGVSENTWYNVIFYRNSSGVITPYLNKVSKSTATYANVLTSQPNIRLGARSSSTAGTSHTSCFKGDKGSESIYQASTLNIQKIIRAEMTVSKNYTGVA